MQTFANINGLFVEFFTDARDPTSCLIERVQPDVIQLCAKLTPRIKRAEWSYYNQTSIPQIKFCWVVQAEGPGKGFLVRKAFKQLKVASRNDYNSYQSVSGMYQDSIYASNSYNGDSARSSTYDNYATSPAGFRKQDILVESGVLEMIHTHQFDFFVEEINKDKYDSREDKKDSYGPDAYGPAGARDDKPKPPPEALKDKDKRKKVFKCPTFVY
jgi:hypothetical protein